MIHSENVINKHYKDINPIEFGFENCKKSYSFGPYIRTHWLLHYVVSGKGFFKIEGREYTVNKGEVFVIPPFVETYYEADSITPWEYIWIGFSADNKLPVQLDDIITGKNVGYIFENMKLCSNLTGGKSEFLCAKLWELFSILKEEGNRKTDYIKSALNIIHSQYVTGITVNEIASMLNLDRTYFSYIFKQKIGSSPKQYLMNYRMEQALNLMENHGYSVSVAALSVGYNDVYNFSKMFKAKYGVSPTKYNK